MARRDLFIKLGIVLLPALPLLAALLAWSTWRFPVEIAVVEEPPPGAAAPALAPAAPSRAAGPAAENQAPGQGEASIEGIVLDPSGEPAAGVEVLLLALDAGPDGASAEMSAPGDPDDRADSGRLDRELEKRLAASLRTSTSADGRFELAVIGAASFRLVARAPGCLPAVSGAIDLEGERPEGPVELRLKWAESIRGTVLSPEGAPVEGARIELEWSAPPRDGPETRRRREEDLLEAALARRRAAARCDPSGRFEVTGLLGGYYDLEVKADGYAPGKLADAPTGDTLLRIVLRPELFLRGEVFDAGGQPVAGAEATLTYLAADLNRDDLGPVDGGAAGEPARGASGDPGAVHRSRTGGDGRFAFGGLARGVYCVEVGHPGYQRARAPVVLVHEAATAEERSLVFRLAEGHGIRGTVRSADGEPLAGAEVRARFRRPLPPGDEAGQERTGDGVLDERSSQVRADGAFEFTSLQSGLYRLVVSAAAHRGRAFEEVAAGGEPLEIELAPLVPIEGVVVDGRTKEPVSGAWVSIRLAAAETGSSESEPDGSSGADRVPRLRTDREGRFRIDRLPEGAHAVVVEAEGYQTIETPPIDGDEDAELTITLDRGGQVSGRVRAGRGLPVEGLRVSLIVHDGPASPAGEAELDPDRRREWSPRRAGRAAFTGDDGSYRLFVPEAGSYSVLVEGCPYVAAWSRVIEIPDARVEVKGVDIDLELAAMVRGRVIDPAGFPVAAAWVLALPVDAAGTVGWAAAVPDSGLVARARADAAGTFEVTGLRPRRFRLAAGAAGYIPARSESFVLAAGSTRGIEIELEPEMTIAGSVFSGDGEPIPWAEIRAVARGEGSRDPWSDERTLSSTPGTFRLGKLGNRRYDLRVTAPGLVSALIEDVPAGSVGVDVRLERPVTLAGRVAGAYSEEPVAEYRLRLQFEAEDRLSARERGSIQEWKEFRDPAGAFSIDGLPPGRYLVAIEAPGHLEAGPTLLELRAGEGLAGVVIPVPERGLLGGVVLDGQARPLAGARVHALLRVADAGTGKVEYRWYSPGRGRPGRGDRRKESEPPDRATTREDGRFWLRGLPDGVYRLSIAHGDFITGDTADLALVDGSGGETAVGVTVYLDPGATLRGSVRWLSDVEGGGLSVYLGSAGGRNVDAAWWKATFKSARVDSTGHFVIRGLAVGEYELSGAFRRSSDGSRAQFRKLVQIHQPVREKGIILELSR